MIIPRVSGWPSVWGERVLAVVGALALGAMAGLAASMISLTISLAVFLGVAVGLALLALASVLVWRYPQASLLGLLVFGAFNYSYMYLAALRGRDPTGVGLYGTPATIVEQSLKEAFYLFLLGLLLLRLVVRRDLPFRKGPLVLPIALFLSYVLFRFLTSGDQLGLGSAVALRNMVEYIPMYFVAASLLHRSRWITRVTYVIIATGVAVSLLAIYEFLVSGSAYWTEVYILGAFRPRVTSTLYNPNNLGQYLVTPLALALGISLCHKGSSRWLRLSLLPLLLALSLTFSRSAYLAALGVILVMALMLGRRRLILWLVLGLALFLLLTLSFFPSLLSGLWGEAFWGTAVARRLNLLSMSFETSSENLILGLGLGQAGNLVAVGRLGSQITGSNTDNYYTVLLVQTGLIGLGLFLAMLLGAAKAGLTTFHRLSDPFLRGVALAIFSLVLAYMFIGGTGQFWENYPQNLYFWTLMGLLTALARIASSPSSAARNPGTNPGTGIEKGLVEPWAQEPTQ